MHIAYVAITIFAALANGYAASLNFAGAESVKVVADRLQLSRKWMIPFGVLLASGALGLLIGIAVPVLGTAVAVGLDVYFICAMAAHGCAHDSEIAGAVCFLALPRPLWSRTSAPQPLVIAPIQHRGDHQRWIGIWLTDRRSARLLRPSGRWWQAVALAFQWSNRVAATWWRCRLRNLVRRNWF